MGDRVLVIEDEGLIRWALAKDLSTRGYGVETARTLARARRKITGGAFGAALLAIHLPDGNGLSLLPLFREQAPGTRVIVISGDTTPSNKHQAFAQGAWQFVDKPFEVHDIERLLEEIFGDHPRRRAHRRYCCRLPLRISVVEATPLEASLDLHNLAATSLDLGPGGIRLRTFYRLRPGQRIEVTTLSKEPPCAGFVQDPTRAVVVWSRPIPDGCEAGLCTVSALNPARAS